MARPCRALVWALWLLACGGPTRPTVTVERVGPPVVASPPVPQVDRGTARAFVAASGEDLPRGAAAAGEPGDLVLRNDRLVAVIRGAGHRGRVAPTGGHLIDLAPVDTDDALGEAALFLDPDGRALPLLTEVGVARDGRDGGQAIVRAAGRDARDEQVQVEVDYVLESGTDRLRIMTTVTHRGRSHYRDFVIGHWMSWGGLSPFVPGPGGELAGQRTRSPWVGADAPRGALLLSGVAGLVEATHGRDFSQVVEHRVHLTPGAVVAWETSLHVAREGGIAAAESMLHAARRTVTGQVRGVLREKRRQRTVTDGWVLVGARDGSWVTRARTGSHGEYVLDLEPGRHRLVAVAAGRLPAPPVEVAVTADGFVEQGLEVDAPGRLRIHLATEDGLPLPGRAALVGRGATPTPTLGAAAGMPLAGNFIHLVTGRFNGRLTPGDYTVTLGAGPAFGQASRPISVRAGETTRLEVRLPRAFDPSGARAVDPRVHTIHGATSAATASARALSCLVEGVGVIVATDERAGEAWPSPSPWPGLVTLRGLELQLADARLGALPMSSVPVLPAALPTTAAGAFPFLAGLPGSPPVAVFRPRARGVGYFEVFGFDPAAPALPRGGFSLAFDALEVLSSGLGADTDRAVADYLALTARGRRVAPLGASGADDLAAEVCGTPRTWVFADVRDAATLEAALRRGAVTASGGPLARALLSEDRREIVVRIAAADWNRPQTAELHSDAGPPIPVDLGVGAGPLMVERRMPVPAGATWVVLRTDGPRKANPLYPGGVRPLAVTSTLLVSESAPGGATTDR
ncbi:hypothetical protein L6V77_30500 [Myxococcota bacterium]|nr:hypothetical protein [Myxococcota bacterium]